MNPDFPYPPLPPEATLVRFEDVDGYGSFVVIADFLDDVRFGHIRLTRRKEREIESLYDHLCKHTPPVPAQFYSDTRNRRPITWFVGPSSPALRSAEKIVRLLNQYGANLHRIETIVPPLLLWRDQIQAVTRCTRKPPREKRPSLVERRQALRRLRQRRRRMRKGRRLARVYKTSFDII